MYFEDFLKPELIWTNSDASTHLEVFELIAAKAHKELFVEDNFLEKIKEREETFPTGLELEGYAVAIPHTDPECVKEQFIAVLTSKEGIPFKRMDDASKEVKANIIFMLGLNEPHSQLEVLQQLMGVLQNKETVEKLLSFDNESDILKYLKGVTK